MRCKSCNIRGAICSTPAHSSNVLAHRISISSRVSLAAFPSYQTNNSIQIEYTAKEKREKEMPFELLPADPTDSPALTTVFLSAFSSPFNQRLFPRTPDVITYWTAQFTSFINNPHKAVLKITNSEDGSIVAFAVWQLPVPSSAEDVHLKHSHSPPHSHAHAQAGDEHPYPASSDRELCEVFFGGMEEMKKRIMGSRPHYCISFFPLILPSGCVLMVHADRLRSGDAGDPAGVRWTGSCIETAPVGIGEG